MAAALNVYKWYVQNSPLNVVISFYEPYLSFSSVFISKKTVNAAGEHYRSTTSASWWKANLFLFQTIKASTVMPEAISTWINYVLSHQNWSCLAMIYYRSQVNAYHSTPFSFITIFINNIIASSTEHIFGLLSTLFVVVEVWTSFCQDLDFVLPRRWKSDK